MTTQVKTHIWHTDITMGDTQEALLAVCGGYVAEKSCKSKTAMSEDMTLWENGGYGKQRHKKHNT
jgi:hypothetical protein